VRQYRLEALGLIALLLLAMAGVGCGGGDGVEASVGETADSESEDPADLTTDDEEPEAVPVEVASLESGEIESVLRFSTNLEAEKQVKVFSQARRLIRELLVEEGDQVARGQLLLRLEDEEQRSAVAKARNQFDKAESEYERSKRLFESDLISREAFNDASFELEQLRISTEDAARELSYTEVTAPIAGTVTSRLVNLGDQVQIGQHLFDLIDFESIVARVFVPEKHLPGLRPGLQARIATSAAGGREFMGSVDRISPVVDPQSGTIKVTVAIGRQEQLRPGLYVDVDLVMATHADAVLIPKRAVVYDSEQMFVYRLGDDQRVQRVYIEPLLADKNYIEPREGLGIGDQIVIAGQAGLKDDARVRLPGQEELIATEDEGGSAEDDEFATVERAAK